MWRLPTRTENLVLTKKDTTLCIIPHMCQLSRAPAVLMEQDFGAYSRPKKHAFRFLSQGSFFYNEQYISICINNSAYKGTSSWWTESSIMKTVTCRTRNKMHLNKYPKHSTLVITLAEMVNVQRAYFHLPTYLLALVALVARKITN
jgi:hypothetical protein